MPATAPSHPVDLRSDTVTRPSPAMRAAMAAAEVGDDLYGEDPSVAALEATVAELFGKDGALFVPSGTMANQIAVRLLVPAGGEILCDADAHLVSYERAGIAWHGGVQTRTLLRPDGLLDVDELAGAIRADGYHTLPTTAIEIEQTHNRGGGTIYPLATLTALRKLADETGVAVHCDGARVWNAHVATGVPLASYGEIADTLSVCLSKGLGAPVGSLVVCAADLLPRARELRGVLGGGMRQAGILAAAGSYALEHNLARLADDHANATLLADRLRAAGHDVAAPQTNIVVLELGARRVEQVIADCAARGVRVGPLGPHTLRLVTHLDVSADDCAHAADVLIAVLADAAG
jgi:threonine aldolase